MQNGVTFKYEGNKQIGLIDKSKFLTLYTSMGTYEGDHEYMDTIKTIMKIELGFMGFKSYSFVHAATATPEIFEDQLEKANLQIDKILSEWKI